jgi:hypothetical protein
MSNSPPQVKGEVKKTREERSMTLIADFVNGYAKDWHFAVGECFKDPLDIKLTERREPLIIDGEVQYEFKTIKGIEKKKVKKISILRWTQGRFFAFEKGFTIYDSPKGYLPWPEAFNYFGKMIQIVEAIPNHLNEKNELITGSVEFDLFKPADCKTRLDLIGQYTVSQNDFVDYLKSGYHEQIEQLGFF